MEKEIISAGAIMVLINFIVTNGLLLRWLNNKIETLDKKKLDAEICQIKHEQVQNDLRKGEENFSAIMEKLEESLKRLTRMETYLENPIKDEEARIFGRRSHRLKK